MKSFLDCLKLMLLFSFVLFITACEPPTAEDEEGEAIHNYDQKREYKPELILRNAFYQSKILVQLAEQINTQNATPEEQQFINQVENSHSELIGELRVELHKSNISLEDSVEVLKRWKKRFDINISGPESFLQAVNNIGDRAITNYSLIKDQMTEGNNKILSERILNLIKKQQEQAQKLMNGPTNQTNSETGNARPATPTE